MKRIAMLLVIALLAIASVFSASQTAKVSFTLTNEKIAAYRIGFTTKANIDAKTGWDSDFADMDNVPATSNEITLDYYKGSAVGSNTDVDNQVAPTNYIYFKARGTSKIELELSATPLKDTSTSGTKLADINYTVKVGEDSKLMNTEGKGTPWNSGLISMDAGNTKSSAYPILIQTENITAANIGDYSSKMTLTITAHN